MTSSSEALHLLRRLAESMHVDPSSIGPTRLMDPLPVHDYLERFLAHQKVRVARRTFTSDAPRLRHFFADIGVRDLRALRSQDITNFMTRRAAAGAAPATLNRIRGCLHTLFVWLIDQELLDRNPVARVRPATVPPPQISFLTLEEVHELLTIVAGDLIAPLVATLVFCGLRRDEAIWLRRDDLNLERRMLRVQAKVIEGESWQTKTGRNRGVPLSPRLFEILNSAPLGTSWLFPAPKGGRWDGQNLYARFRRIVRAHGKQWTLLDLRHTFASHLAMKGVSLVKIAALMGNSPEICRRHYAHIATEDMHADVAF